LTILKLLPASIAARAFRIATLGFLDPDGIVARVHIELVQWLPIIKVLNFMVDAHCPSTIDTREAGHLARPRAMPKCILGTIASPGKSRFAGFLKCVVLRYGCGHKATPGRVEQVMEKFICTRKRCKVAFSIDQHGWSATHVDIGIEPS